jgi:hypothetical protein
MTRTPKLISRADTAVSLGVHVRTVDRFANDKILTKYVQRGAVFFPETQVKDLIKARNAAPVPVTVPPRPAKIASQVVDTPPRHIEGKPIDEASPVGLFLAMMDRLDALGTRPTEKRVIAHLTEGERGWSAVKAEWVLTRVRKLGFKVPKR